MANNPSLMFSANVGWCAASNCGSSKPTWILLTCCHINDGQGAVADVTDCDVGI